MSASACRRPSAARCTRRRSTGSPHEGISYNTFHTTSICSPTRASLLTGRNHTRVGNGTIAERAVAFDGYTGVIPKTAATIAEVLKNYGYHTAAFGKWHNTPAIETTAIGPKDRWPNGYGFEYFYGFLGGETSQWEPRLTENYDAVEPPHDDPNYHLTDGHDRTRRWTGSTTIAPSIPDKPFLMYWAPGGVHGPHHVFPEWADKYKGKFDTGWDAYRERVYKRQLEMGVIPPGTELTPRDPTMASWDSIPEAQRPFQERLMELFAGFVEHTDTEVGRLIDGMEARGLRDNTLIFYIFGDNGSSAEGQQGSISELLAQNNIAEHGRAADRRARQDRRSRRARHVAHRQHVPCRLGLGRQHAVQGHQADGVPISAARAIRWSFPGPAHIKHDGKMRQQFHHVDRHRADDLRHPGHHPRRRSSTATSRCRSTAPAWPTPSPMPRRSRRKTMQFFDNNGSRGIYHDGWFAGANGPFIPWDTPGSAKRLADLGFGEG